MTNYGEVLNGAFANLLECGQSSDGWTSVGETKGIAVFKKSGDGSINSIRGTGLIKASAEKILNAIEDGEMTKKWDETLADVKVVEKIDANVRIEHLTYKASWPTSPRDFCIVTGVQKKDDGTIISANKSVVHPGCPDVKGNVRGEVIDGGFILKPVADGYEVTYVTKVDLKGSLPSSVVNKVNENAPVCVAKLRDLVQA